MGNNNLKQRNGCITAWLWLVIIANLLTTVFYVATMFEANTSGIAIGFGICAILCIVNVLGAILLMRWNKTGFYIFVVSSIINALTNILVLNVSSVVAISCIIAIIIWWAILQAKKDGVSTWEQLDTGWDYKHCRHLYQLFAVIGVILCVLTLTAACLDHSNPKEKIISDSNEEDVIVELAEEGENQVKNMFWESPLGMASYTGDVSPDSIAGSDAMIPNGYGVARIVDGEYKGNTYDGNFEWGVMQGNATYTTVDGDIFRGSFRDNKYYKGTYTIKETGEYFVGTFKNGQPDEGDWFDKDGNKL